MDNQIKISDPHEIIQKLVLDGDLSRMSGNLKVEYYNRFCDSLGLNPLTQPFQIIKFQGKEKLYATKDCTEQLRKIHGVSITDISTTSLNGVFIVTAKALDKTGKTDAATGAVTIDNLKGDNLANALMKAETKAKRRVTLSICGLGMLDESELETMPVHETKSFYSEISQPFISYAEPEESFPGPEYPMIEISDSARDELMRLLASSTYEGKIKDKLFSKINSMTSWEDFDKAKENLLQNQGGIDTIVNPSQRDINRHLKNSV